MTSSLAARIKRQARQSAETAFRTKILFDTNRQLGSEQDADGIVSVTCNQLQKLLGKDVIFYSVGEEGLRAPQFFPAHPGIGPDAYTTGNERAVASWVYHNNKQMCIRDRQSSLYSIGVRCSSLPCR